MHGTQAPASATSLLGEVTPLPCAPDALLLGKEPSSWSPEAQVRPTAEQRETSRYLISEPQFPYLLHRDGGGSCLWKLSKKICVKRRHSAWHRVNSLKVLTSIHELESINPVLQISKLSLREV